MLKERSSTVTAALIVVIVLAVASIFWTQYRRSHLEALPSAPVSIPKPPGVRGPG